MHVDVFIPITAPKNYFKKPFFNLNYVFVNPMVIKIKVEFRYRNEVRLVDD